MADEPTIQEIQPESAPASAFAGLVAAIAQGDCEAERALVDHFQPRLRAMLLARTRNSDLAADLVQEALIESICALRCGQLREAEKLPGFMLGIARNVLNSHFRGAARAPESLEFPDRLPDPRSMHDDFESTERQSRALAAIETLEPIDRKILQMTLVDGLKPGVIAEQLRLKPEMVRQRKLRATRRIVEFVTGRSQNPAGLHLVSGQRA